MGGVLYSGVITSEGRMSIQTDSTLIFRRSGLHSLLSVLHCLLVVPLTVGLLARNRMYESSLFRLSLKLTHKPVGAWGTIGPYILISGLMYRRGIDGFAISLTS